MRPNDENTSVDILVVDDDPAVLSLLSHLLEANRYKVRTASDGNQALQTILQDCPDVLITDSAMPCLDGLELTRRVRQLHARKVLPHYVYILLMTNQSSKSALVEGLEFGVDDFIEKSVSSLSDLRVELQARMNAARRIRQLEASLEFAAKYDYLTQLLNRITFFNSAGSLWERSAKNKSPISAVMLDCDWFKRINDIYGHTAGDMVLKEISATMKKFSRSSDLLCRYGGEEFVAFLPGCNEEMAFEWADRLRLQFETNPIKRDNFDISITVSFGVADRDDISEMPEQLIDKADMALLQAKEQGRNRVIRHSQLLLEGSRFMPVSNSPIHRICAGIKAGEVAEPFPMTLNMNDTVSTAMYRFRKSPIETLPVFTDVGFFAGVVTLRDLFPLFGDRSRWVQPISTLVSQSAVTYPPDTPLQTLFDFFNRTNSQSILITDNKTQVSYISRLFLATWLQTHLANTGGIPGEMIPKAGTDMV